MTAAGYIGLAVVLVGVLGLVLAALLVSRAIGPERNANRDAADLPAPPEGHFFELQPQSSGKMALLLATPDHTTALTLSLGKRYPSDHDILRAANALLAEHYAREHLTRTMKRINQR
ncbi:MAG: hypothetical protein ACOYD1_07915 [Candidatus Nanopelagicales bacterium]